MPKPQQPQFLAALLGWCLPGLGHISIGHKRRGTYILLGAMSLIIGGIFIGGIDAVDHKNDFLWFLAQAGAGPIVVLIDLCTQNMIASLPVDEKASLVGLSHVNEIGTLFIAMAGLMNVVMMLDVLYREPGEDLEKRLIRREGDA